MKGRKVFMFFTIVLGLFVVVFVVLQVSKIRLNSLARLAISDVDLSKASDGIYPGNYSAFPISVEVKVTIKDHRITGIELIKHRTGQGAPAEIIPGKVVESQTLQVDAVSGATYSSKVILKAIQNALNRAVAGH